MGLKEPSFFAGQYRAISYAYGVDCGHCEIDRLDQVLEGQHRRNPLLHSAQSGGQLRKVSDGSEGT